MSVFATFQTLITGLLSRQSNRLNHSTDLKAALQAAYNSIPRKLHSVVADVALAEAATTEYFIYSILAGTLKADGDHVTVRHHIKIDNAQTNQGPTIKFTFNGTDLLSATVSGLGAIDLILELHIIRESNTVVKVDAKIIGDAANTAEVIQTAANRLTGLNLTTNDYQVSGKTTLTSLFSTPITGTAKSCLIMYYPQ